MIQLLVTFAVCFMTGAIYFNTCKLSQSTWNWYIVALVCSIPSFRDVISFSL